MRFPFPSIRSPALCFLAHPILASPPRCFDTPRGLKPDGFSVHCRSLRHDSPKGLPGPLDIARRVLVSIEHETAGRADMGAYRETLRHTFPATATVLAGVVSRNRDRPTPSVCCFGFEDGTELRPTRIMDALSQVMIPYHIGDLQIFEIDGVVLAQQMQRGLVVEVEALALDVLMRLAQQRFGLAASLTPLLPFGDAALR